MKPSRVPRLFLCLALALSGCTEAARIDGRTIPEWVEATRAFDLAGRVRAVRVLGTADPSHPLVVPALVAALTDTSPLVRADAAAALARIGPGVAPGLTRSLYRARPNVRHPAVDVLIMLGPAAVPALVDSLAEAPLEARARIVRALGMLRVPEAAEVLLPALLDGDVPLRVEALLALGRLGPDAAGVLPAVVMMLDDDSPLVRFSAASALGMIGSSDPSVTAGLVARVADEDLVVSVAALRSLGELRESNEACLARFLEALESSSQPRRLAAARAVGAIGPPAGSMAPALARALASKNARLTDQAVASLTRLGPQAVGPLMGALGHRRSAVRAAATRALEGLGPVAAPALVERYGEASGRTERFAVLDALGLLGPDAVGAAEFLDGLLEDRDRRIRRRASQLLIALEPALAAAASDSGATEEAL